jgi:hypothetical protein
MSESDRVLLRKEIMAREMKSRKQAFKQNVTQVAESMGYNVTRDTRACDCIKGMQKEVSDAIEAIKRGEQVNIKETPLLLG